MVVYIIECNGFYKIGKATNINKRLSSLQVSSPYELRLVAIKTCENIGVVEKIIHKAYRTTKVRGEWYALNITSLSSLINIYGFKIITPLDELTAIDSDAVFLINKAHDIIEKEIKDEEYYNKLLREKMTSFELELKASYGEQVIENLYKEKIFKLKQREKEKYKKKLEEAEEKIYQDYLVKYNEQLEDELSSMRAEFKELKDKFKNQTFESIIEFLNENMPIKKALT
jgi:hypothetical protein